MTDKHSLISDGFRAFLAEAPAHAQAWSTLVQALGKASSLDAKTAGLAYLAVLAALRMVSGIPFHVRAVKELGASREEVIHAILLGLPLAGNSVTQSLPAAVAAYDAE